MPYKDPEKAREHAKLRSRKYRQNHPERVKASQKKLYYDNLEKNRAYARAQQKKYRLQNPEKYRAISREFYKTRPEYRMNYNRTKRKEHRARDKLEIFTIYSKRLSNSEIPICNCCGEDQIDFLTIDHIIPRLRKGDVPCGPDLYREIKHEGYPEGYQVLCFNCNSGKGTKTVCSHKTQTSVELDPIRKEIVGHYSKNSFQCNCCGEDKIDFLTIDHIEGKKQMDSDKNLVSLGYNSKMSSYSLYKWIINNNFPDGFQILCTNCNCAKGVFGICPHINSS